MNYIITPYIRKAADKRYYVAASTNGTMTQPLHNFRKTYNGALRLITECVNAKADELRKFGNEVHINQIKNY